MLMPRLFHRRRRLLTLTALFAMVTFVFYFQLPIPLDSLPPHQLKSAPSRSTISPRSIPATSKPIINMTNVYRQLAFDNQPGGVWKQGFDIHYNFNQWSQEAPLEVFLVLHSHQDPGWRLTIDQYFDQFTKNGLDAALEIFKQHPQARFIYAEISFFSKWVATLSPDKRQELAKALASGQMEITSGGWVMPDEASTHHYAIIDQIIEGHQWLSDNFDYRPNTSWAIDPFGHSTSMAYFLSKLPYTGMLIQRAHYEVKKYLAQRQALEFKWRQQWDTSGDSDMLCHLMPFYHYDPPHTCGPDPSICCQFDFEQSHCPWKIDPVAITEENVAERAQLLADQYRKKASLYASGDIVLIPLGDDFRFTRMTGWKSQLTNYDQLIDYFNSHPELRIKMKYATLSDYFKALQNRTGFPSTPEQRPPTLSLPSLVGDFHTYTDRERDYWSGYFTSRPVQKYLSRELENTLRSTELLYAYALYLATKSTTDQQSKTIIDQAQLHLIKARRNLGLFQHHDGITGTSKREVVDDFSARLLNALNGSRTVAVLSSRLIVSLALNFNLADLVSVDDQMFTDKPPVAQPIKLSQGHHQSTRLLLFNQLTYQRRVMLSIKIDGQIRSIIASTGSSSNQLPTSTTTSVNDLGQSFLLHIGPILLHPLHLTPIELRDDPKLSSQINAAPTEEDVEPRPIEIENSRFILRFNAENCLLKSIHNKQSGVTVQASIDFVEYHTNLDEKRSGPYLINIVGDPKPFRGTIQPDCIFNSNNLFDEVTVKTIMFRHTLRLHKSDDPLVDGGIEIENDIDLSRHQANNIEVVMRINTDLVNPDRTFFTDSNCYQFIRREYLDKVPLQGNIYPVTCGLFFQGRPSSTPSSTTTKHQRLNIFTYHSLGASVWHMPGQAVLWIDRRSSTNDDRGLNDVLTGAWIARSKFKVTLEEVDSLLENYSNKFISTPPPETDHHSFTPGSQLGFILRRLSLLQPHSTSAGVLSSNVIGCDATPQKSLEIAHIFSNLALSPLRLAVVPVDLDLIPSSDSPSSTRDQVSIPPSELGAFLLV